MGSPGYRLRGSYGQGGWQRTLRRQAKGQSTGASQALTRSEKLLQIGRSGRAWGGSVDDIKKSP